MKYLTENTCVQARKTRYDAELHHYLVELLISRCREITDVSVSGIQMQLLFSQLKIRKNYLSTCARLDMVVLAQSTM